MASFFYRRKVDDLTIIEAISRLDNLKFNTYTQEDKIEWLSRLDSAIKTQILDKHEGNLHAAFSGYDKNTPLNTELIVPAPYDDLYLHWMESQVDYYNGEYDKFNNAILLYNTSYDAFAKHYKGLHMPVSFGSQFVF